MISTLLLTDVFACWTHRISSPAATADPLESFDQQNKHQDPQVKYGSMAQNMPVPVTSTHGLQCLSYCRQNEWHNQVSLDAGQDSYSQSTFLQTKHIPSGCRTVSDHLRVQNTQTVKIFHRHLPRAKQTVSQFPGHISRFNGMLPLSCWLLPSSTSTENYE